MNTDVLNQPWVITRLDHLLVALPVRSVRELVPMPTPTPLPFAPADIRGMINLRGRTMPLIDTRKRLGLASALDAVHALCALMEQREQDHRRWLQELEASVREERAFPLALDPHQCAFGRWYDTYETTDPWQKALLRRFDVPHQRIHAVGRQVEALKAQGRPEEAHGLIQQAQDGVLAQLLKLFADFRSLVREAQGEIAVVITAARGPFALAVDAALSVESLLPGSIKPLPAVMGVRAGEIRWLAKRPNGSEIVLLVETDRMYEPE